MSDPHALPTQEKWIKLSKKEVKHIFIYYFAIFILSLIIVGVIIYRLINLATDNLGLLLVFAFVCGLLGSTFYYIRKLYKSCIQLIVDTESASDTVRALGAKVYFYFRPIMGATLAALIILGIYGGFFFLQDQPTINTEKFYIFTAVVSFVVGFSNGNIIVQLDKSKDKIAKMIKFGKEE